MDGLTDLADQAVVLPMLLALGVTLAAEGRRRAAGAWFVAVGGTLAAMLVLKVLCLACEPILPGLALRSPSGHTAAATVVVGGLAVLLRLRWPWLLAVATAVLIGGSRLALGVHSGAEVAVGAAVGLLGVAVLAALAGQPPARVVRWPLVAVGALVLAAFYGHRLRAEAGITELALTYARPLLTGVCTPG